MHKNLKAAPMESWWGANENTRNINKNKEPNYMDYAFSPWYVETIRALALHQRLAILRDADELRMWSSLDHQRVCTFCKKTFTGHQVQIRGLANDKYEVRCPTEGCTSSPQQWEYPGTPPYSDKVDADWWRPLKRTSGSVAEEVKNG